jgi:hypothetical protein
MPTSQTKLYDQPNKITGFSPKGIARLAKLSQFQEQLAER